MPGSDKIFIGTSLSSFSFHLNEFLSYKGLSSNSSTKSNSRNAQLLILLLICLSASRKIRMAISRKRKELPEINWCQNNRIFEGFLVTCVQGSHGLSARRAQRTKSRGPKGLQLEVRAQRAPGLLVHR